MASGTMDVVIKNYNELVKDIENIEKQSEKVVQRTISDFKSRAPGWVSKEVVKEYNIKKSDVNETNKGVRRGRIKIRAGGKKINDLCILYQGRRLTPTHFGMSPEKMPELTDKKVTIRTGNKFHTVRSRAPITLSATIKKGHRVTINGKYNEPVFIAANPKKKDQYIPFQRKGKERTNFVSIRTVSVPQMITNEKVSKNIRKQINEKLGKRLEHHVKTALKQSKRG